MRREGILADTVDFANMTEIGNPHRRNESMSDFLKPNKARPTQLEAWPVVSSTLFQYAQSSDDIISIVSSAGLDVDWNLNPTEAFSHTTRKRAYRPRVDAAHSKLGDADRNTVMALIIAELATRFPAHSAAVKNALTKVGWTLKSSADVPQTATKNSMKRIRELQRLLLLQVRDGEPPNELSQYSEQDQVYNSALLIGDGYVTGDTVEDGSGVVVSTVMIQLTSKGHDFLEQFEALPSVKAVAAIKVSSKKIFISHSAADKDLAEAI